MVTGVANRTIALKLVLPPLALQAYQPDEPHTQDRAKEINGMQPLTETYPVSKSHAINLIIECI